LAVRWGKLRENPIGKVKRLHEENHLERILSPEEQARFLRAANEPLRTILMVALHTGMRRGEILTLPWSCVDFERALITVVNPKNGRSRKIPVNEILAQTLRRRKPDTDGAIFVFADPETGQPWGSVKTAFRASLRRAGIAGFRFHDMRHTFATRLVDQGVDLLTVKELLGHASITMTMRYAHPSQKNMRRAVELLSPDGHQMDTAAEELEGVGLLNR
jgi:integrase